MDILNTHRFCCHRHLKADFVFFSLVYVPFLFFSLVVALAVVEGKDRVSSISSLLSSRGPNEVPSLLPEEVMEEFGLSVAMADLDVPVSITYLEFTESLVPQIWSNSSELGKRFDVFAALPWHSCIFCWDCLFYRGNSWLTFGNVYSFENFCRLFR